MEEDFDHTDEEEFDKYWDSSGSGVKCRRCGRTEHTCDDISYADDLLICGCWLEEVPKRKKDTRRTVQEV